MLEAENTANGKNKGNSSDRSNSTGYNSNNLQLEEEIANLRKQVIK